MWTYTHIGHICGHNTYFLNVDVDKPIKEVINLIIQDQNSHLVNVFFYEKHTYYVSSFGTLYILSIFHREDLPTKFLDIQCTKHYHHFLGGEGIWQLISRFFLLLVQPSSHLQQSFSSKLNFSWQELPIIVNLLDVSWLVCL